MKWKSLKEIKVEKGKLFLFMIILMLIIIIVGLMLQYNQLVDAYNVCATELQEFNNWRFII